MIFSRTLISALVAFTSASFATAQVYYGSTTDKPTWTRPTNGTPPTLVSLIGADVRYDVKQFYVDVTGSYTFQSTAIFPKAWDNFSFLYQDTFSPTDQLKNILIGNDDNSVAGLSGFTWNLTKGRKYFFVETGFWKKDYGFYQLDIRGPGTAKLVPEPATIAGLLVGGLALVRRRRKSI